ncbi:MAG: hypothetical protein WBL49_03290 [Nitrososphaeraceae archaeon]
MSPVVYATTELMTENPVIDRIAAPVRITDIANIVIVFIGKSEGSQVYKGRFNSWL